MQIDEIRLVGGADVSYCTEESFLYGAVVVLSYPELSVMETTWVRDKVRFPYIPGFLSFREAPVLVQAFQKLRQLPDAIIFDGQGVSHSRGFGLASHLGVLLNIPSVGCAKSRLVGNYSPVGTERGASSLLEFEGQPVGRVVRTRRSVNPVFVSPGHRISFQGATNLVLTTCRGYRLPEPIRKADQLVNRLKKKKPVDIEQ